jgi:hypothetical protein
MTAHHRRQRATRPCAANAVILAILVLLTACSAPRPPARAAPVPTPGRALLQRIYIIPLGDVREPSLPALAVSYRDRYRIPVDVLATLPLGPSEIDADRRQVAAEALLALMRRSYASQADDRGALLIGVTPEDMYIHARPDWRWAFADRVGPRFAVISTYMMTPGRVRSPFGFFERPRPGLLDERLRKMVTKTIALQYYGMETNDDPKSVLYSRVLGLADLDAISEEPDPILGR